MAEDSQEPEEELEEAEEEPIVSAPTERGGWRWFWTLLILALVVVAALVGLQRWEAWKRQEQAKREAEAQAKSQIVRVLGKISDAQKKLEAADLEGCSGDLESAVKGLDLVVPDAPEEMRGPLGQVRQAVGEARNVAEEQQQAVDAAKKAYEDAVQAAVATVKDKVDAAVGKARAVGGTPFVEPAE